MLHALLQVAEREPRLDPDLQRRRPRAPASTILTAALVLAVMILPIMTAICREVFLQTPKLHEEAALALGATRWEMVRMAVLPFARSGMVSGAMLGLGRALGETMAVTHGALSPRHRHASTCSPDEPDDDPREHRAAFPEAHDDGRQHAHRRRV